MVSRPHVPFLILFVLCWGLALSWGVPLRAQAPDAPINTTCPVMPENEVDEDSVVVTYKGVDVRLCCKRCRRKFLADPEKYAGRLPAFADVTESETSGTDGAAIQARQEESGHEHDHGEDHEEGGAFSFLGRFHPLVVHFPIGLLLFAAFLELLALRKAATPYGAPVRPLVLGGAVAAVAAMGLGLLLAREGGRSGDALELLEKHETLGIVTASLAVFTALLGEWGRKAGSRFLLKAFRISLLATVVVLGITAHLGGSLVFGPDYLFPAG